MEKLIENEQVYEVLTPFKLIIVVLNLFIICSCTAPNTSSTASKISVDQLRIAINQQTPKANTREDIRQLIALHNQVIAQQPTNKISLAALAQLNTLMGAAYTHKRSKKGAFFKKAMVHAESIMALNDNFSEDVKNGISVWDASIHLTENESDGLGWWSTATLYYYREVIPAVFKIFNYKLIVRSKMIMDQLNSVNPEWEKGTNYFNLAIYYHALPQFAGGDKVKSKMFMKKAEEAGPNRLLIPWGKAKYFYLEQGNNSAFNQEINRILNQDIHFENGEYYAWRVYFQNDARTMANTQ